jgi:hypothetical protein
MADDDWKESQDCNVFQMAVANGGPGFWVRRTTWDGSIARVVRLGEFTGPPPYFGSPSVLMDVYSLSGELRDEAAQLPAAGTYKTWRLVDAPEWAASAKLRSLNDPTLDDVLYKLNKKRHKLRAPPERLWLTVEYVRRDEAKKLGARWAATERKWWLPADAPAAVLAEAQKKGFIV